MMIWGALGVLIIVGLFGYWLHLLRLIRKARLRQTQQQQQAIRMRQDTIADSVQTIAKACIHSECERSEGAIRLSQLLLAYPEAKARDWAGLYPGVFGLYRAIEHLPTHQQRLDLPRTERVKQDQYRQEQEQQFAELYDAEMVRLSGFFDAGEQR